MSLLRELLDSLRNFVATIGAVTLFFGRTMVQLPRALTRPGLIVDQIHNAGAMSLVIIMTCGLFVGGVLGLTGYDLLLRFGSEDALGTAAALALIKQLGPVVTALLFAGRAGTALASEIGLMRATDQLKFVICSRSDFEWSRNFVRDRNLTRQCTVLFSPSASQIDARDLAQWILDDRLPVRMQVQLHKVLWGDTPGR